MVYASVLIKANDQHVYLEKSLPIISHQTINDYETFLLYSGHNEATKELARQWGVKIIDIDPRTFSHPRVLNKGAHEARGEFLVFLSGDAVPTNERWLENLLRPFEDPNVAGVYGRHVPRKDVPVHGLDRIRMNQRYGEIGRVQEDCKDKIFSNANSAIRKRLWEKHNFDERLEKIEDYEWSSWAQKEGGKIVYEPTAAVEHTHYEQYGPLKYLARIVDFTISRIEIDRQFHARHIVMGILPTVTGIFALVDLIMHGLGYPSFLSWFDDIFLLLVSISLLGTVLLLHKYADHPGS